MLLDLDPGADTNLTLHDLDPFFLANCVLADSPVVGRHLCWDVSHLINGMRGPERRWNGGRKTCNY